tara:strand:+ start:242 stop:613 length:372 start_codon:yes stop_codon:yes gene_type:complete
MRRDDGFAMADALVALVLASLFLTGLLSVNAASLHSAESGENRLTAALIARAVIEDPSLREDTGRLSVNGRIYDWRRTQQARPSDLRDRAMVVDISVEIRWAGRSGELVYSLKTTRMKGRTDA